jgi:uncharacterized protein involved in exopolysaccharide biosynthesis
LGPVTDHDAPEVSGEPPEELAENPLSPKEIAAFVLRAVRHNLAVCLLVAAVIAMLGSTIVSALPQTYEATFKIFVQDSAAVASSITTGREHRPSDAARGLEELVLSHDNLLSIVRESRLVDKWPETRALPLKLKDQLWGTLFGAPARHDMERMLAAMLETSISGEKEGESVRMRAQWRDKQSAFDIAQLVKRNFLASRAAIDLGPIQRAIPYLEAQLEQADQAIETAVLRLQSNKTQVVSPSARKLETSPAKAAADKEASELAALSRQLSETRRRQRELADPWRQRLAQLKTELVDIKALYTAEHPKVQQLEARIKAASEVPEELAGLRAKEAELLSTLSSRRGGHAAVAAADRSGDAQAAAPSEDPELVTNKERFFAALRKSDEVAERLEAARVELLTAESEFKHHYVVIEEPEVPEKALKAKKPLLFALVFVAAILLGIVAGAVRELMRDRLVETWQVRSLGLPLLAEVELEKLPPPNNV